MDISKYKVVDKFLNQGKLPTFEIEITPSTLIGLGFVAFLVGGSLMVLGKIFKRFE